MNKIGSLIFYDIETGDLLVNTGDKLTTAPVRTADYYIERYKELSERNRETFDYIELEYGQYRQDFTESIGCRVNPETKELEFSYPDSNTPEEPRPFRAPLSEQVEILERRTKEAENAILTLMDLTLMGGL